MADRVRDAEQRARDEVHAEYGRMITWDTTCSGCADRLDQSYADWCAGHERGLAEGVREAEQRGAALEQNVLGDHPHIDPGDGRTECYLCGKFVHDIIHSCKGVPVTRAAEWRVRSLIHAAEQRATVQALWDAADALSTETEGEDLSGTATWPNEDRDVYSLAIEEAQTTLRARADRLAGASKVL